MAIKYLALQHIVHRGGVHTGVITEQPAVQGLVANKGGVVSPWEEKGKREEEKKEGGWHIQQTRSSRVGVGTLPRQKMKCCSEERRQHTHTHTQKHTPKAAVMIDDSKEGELGCLGALHALRRQEVRHVQVLREDHWAHERKKNTAAR